MHYSSVTSKYSLIGTVQGGGYDCRKNKVYKFEGSDNGVWNKVSFHVDWIKKTVREMDSVSGMCLDWW